MKLLADFHVHSKNSRFGHGKNSIEEMAIAANEIGLVEIAITDHGYKHLFRTNKQKMKQARKIVDDINEWSKTKVLLGIEADIIDENGTLDVDNETLSMLDFLTIGYHKMIMTDFAGFLGGTKDTPEARQKCTNAYINALKRYPVTMVAHLDSILTTDMYEIGKVCAERGAMIEINNRHTHWTAKQVEDLIASGCMFAISSDAHSREKVGVVDRAMEYISKYDIPSERVVNVEFTEEEKSEAEREFDAYKSIYEKLNKEKQEFEQEQEEKRVAFSGGNLSSEMEDELRKIAMEQGIDIDAKPKPKTETFQGYINENMDENAKLIAMAEEYIRNARMKEIAEENDGLSDVDVELNRLREEQEKYLSNDELLSIDDTSSLLVEESDSFQNRFQAINNLVKDAEDENLEEKEIFVEPIKPRVNSRVEINRTPTKKAAAKEQKVETNKHYEPRVVEPENFMSSITRTKLAQSQGEQKIEQVVEEKPKKAATTRRKNSGGFIAVDGLLDGDK